MTESSDSGSVLSLQTENAGEKKQEEKRFYSLYLFNSKFKKGTDESMSMESTSDAGESTSCLSVAATNLPAHTESDLRKALTQRLLNKTRPYGEGYVFPLGLNLAENTSSSSSCYCCIAKSTSDSLGFDHIKQDDPLQDDPLGSGEDGECLEFVVCFISFHDSSLDLFRGELDEYTHDLVPLLDKELSQVSTSIQHHLEQWPTSVLGYLTRTMECMGQDIQQLIYAALLNANLQVSGASIQLEQDIKKFFQCCNLSGLLEKPEMTSVSNSTEVDNSDKLDNSDMWQLQPVVISVSVQGGQAKFEKSYKCQFCKNVTDKLMSQDSSNVGKIREFLESIKLAFAHNLNKLKRFLGQAEVDFYALYRALSYLRKCGCGDLLLRYVKMDATSETLSVVSVLEQFITDMGQTLT